MKTLISTLAALVLAGTGCRDTDTRYDHDYDTVAPKPVETTYEADRNTQYEVDTREAENDLDRNTQGIQDDLSRAGDSIDRNTQGIQNDMSRAGQKVERAARRAGQKIENGWNNARDVDVDVDVKTERDVDRN